MVIEAFLTGGIKNVQSIVSRIGSIAENMLAFMQRAITTFFGKSLKKLGDDLVGLFTKITEFLGKGTDEIVKLIRLFFAELQAQAVVAKKFGGVGFTFFEPFISPFLIRKITKAGLLKLEKAKVFIKRGKGVFLFEFKGVILGAFKTEKELADRLRILLKQDKNNLTRSLDELFERVGMGVEKILKVKGKAVASFTRGEIFEILIKDGRKLFGGNSIKLSRESTVVVTGTVKDVEFVKTFSRKGNRVWKTGVNIGGIDILSSKRWFEIQEKFIKIKSTNLNLYWETVKDEFWREVNQPWLDDVIARGDSVRFVSNPKSKKSLYSTDRKTGKLIKDESGGLFLSIFGREINYLIKNGYKIEGEIASKIK
ncbi:hypothetical protein GCM10011344_24910 [Dokdonia pacifica]|uniref:Uncharacterized protein n=1 Tax=Dokdonia pacifica TaxID=1627892 RepID=A0A238WR09_9FLAO|nr:hypothetical protein [Dokdonia pacifica]GGG23199.1 hypothetical protein GCM10011344_24910 [Dokdonia pacifica]SNR48694.1 hypothetical protein SAMN06265376_1011321 [Dokdonia pacifica]